MKKDNSNIKILVCCHKPGEWKSDDIYMPIHCGKAISEFDLGIQGDDTGDNISAKNKYYCELTAHYWAWKNLKNIDYIGLCHYRRWFKFDNQIKIKRRFFFMKRFNEIDFNFENLSLLSMLGKSDIIVIKKLLRPKSNYDCILSTIDDYNFDILTNVVRDLYPEYEFLLLKLLESNELFAYNMFVLKWNLFVDYSNWLFSILFEMEERMQDKIINERVYGYLGELLLNVYILKNNLKTDACSCYFINDKLKQNSFLKETLLDFKMSMLYFMNYIKK